MENSLNINDLQMPDGIPLLTWLKNNDVSLGKLDHSDDRLIGYESCKHSLYNIIMAQIDTHELKDEPKCCVCGTTDNLFKDGWYGYRCSSRDCVCF